MILNELQLCLTNSCSYKCAHCHVDKSEIKFFPKNHIDQVIAIAKSWKVPAIRLTGGDVFEHEDLKEILKEIKINGLQVIVNSTIKRIGDVFPLLDYIDILLFSFTAISDVHENGERLGTIKERMKPGNLMGCFVFEPNWLDRVNEIHGIEEHFDVFFFLRDVNTSSYRYFITLHKFISRSFSTIDKIKVANGFPLCILPPKYIARCAGGRFDNGHERLYIDCEGRLKTAAYSNIVLENISDSSLDIHDAWHMNQKKIRNLLNETLPCCNCVLRPYCKGGILVKEGYGEDPLLRYAINYMKKLEDRKHQSSYNKFIKYKDV